MAKKDTGGTSKADMVRDAIKSLGWDAGSTAMHGYILQTYGVDMSKAHISQTVSKERKRQGVRPVVDAPPGELRPAVLDADQQVGAQFVGDRCRNHFWRIGR